MTKISPETHPARALLAGSQRKATIIILLSSWLCCAWYYFGRAKFYNERIADHFALWNDRHISAEVYTYLCAFVLLGLIPALVVKWVFRERLADYGVCLGDWRRGIRMFLCFGPFFLFGSWMAAHMPAYQAMYPIGGIRPVSAGMFAFHALTYFVFYMSWEFHFRGFLQFGLKQPMGTMNALLVQVIVSCLVHLGKPPGETFGSIFAAVLWGIFALRTRSLLTGLLMHAMLGIVLDALLLYVIVAG